MTLRLIIAAAMLLAGCAAAPQPFSKDIQEDGASRVPPYPVELLDPLVQDAESRPLPLPQLMRDRYSPLPGHPFEKNLAAEYGYYVQYLREVLAGTKRTGGEAIFECTYDKDTKHIYMKAVNIPIAEVAERIALEADVNIVIHPSLTAPLTLTADNRTVMETLRLVARQGGAVLEERGTVISLRPGKTLRVSDIKLPGTVPPEQCHLYLDAAGELFCGEIIIFHKKEVALHLLYDIRLKPVKVTKLRILATRLAGR